MISINQNVAPHYDPHKARRRQHHHHAHPTQPSQPATPAHPIPPKQANVSPGYSPGDFFSALA